jgi:TRAP-type C4-dicarboxylate transport system substrate-binding protein
MKRSIVGTFLVCSMFLLILLASVPSYAQEKVISLRFAHFMPSTSDHVALARDWAKEVEKRTNGRVKVTVYPGSTVMPVAQTYDGITKGIADIGYGIFTYHRGRFPLTEVIDLPLGYKSGYYATKLVNEYYKKFKPKEYDDVKVMFLDAHGPGFFHTRKPVAKLEDLKGMKIRSGGLQSKIAAALGAAPVSIPVTEAYDALSKGVADGISLPDEGIMTWSLGDVVKYHTRNWGTTYTAAFYTVMNKGKWNSLPKDIQNIIEKINEEWIEKAGIMWQTRDDNMRTALAKKGNKFVELTKEEDARWAALVKPILADYVKMTKEKGLPGDQALEFCQDYLKKNDKVDYRKK